MGDNQCDDAAAGTKRMRHGDEDDDNGMRATAKAATAEATATHEVEADKAREGGEAGGDSKDESEERTRAGGWQATHENDGDRRRDSERRRSNRR